MITSAKVNANHRDREDDSGCNPNPVCYELLAPFYEAIYERIDADETVRQWWQLLVEAKLVSDPPEALRLVDIGCGPGWHLEAWADMGFRVAGVDASPSMLELARRRFATAGRSVELYLADVREERDIPASLGFDLAVSHFNLPNLFPPEERESLFRAAARLVRPGGYWIMDFSEPDTPSDAVEEIYHCGGKTIHRRGQLNPGTARYEQRWQGDCLDCTEYFWFGFLQQVETIAPRTGWRPYRRMAWMPYQRQQPWKPVGEGGEVFVDIYQRLEG